MDRARFDVFTRCDVYREGAAFLYVEGTAWDYHGNYTARPYLDGAPCDYVGASGAYVAGLELAPWEDARRIILQELHHTAYVEKLCCTCADCETCANEGCNVPIILDAIEALEDAEPNENFYY